MKKADPNPKANRNILKLVYVIVALFLGLIAYMALPRNRTAKNTAPLAYAIRLRGRVPADAALTKMDGKMADFFGEKDS